MSLLEWTMDIPNLLARLRARQRPEESDVKPSLEREAYDAIVELQTFSEETAKKLHDLRNEFLVVQGKLWKKEAELKDECARYDDLRARLRAARDRAEGLLRRAFTDNPWSKALVREIADYLAAAKEQP